jgi:hypothetical protein
MGKGTEVSEQGKIVVNVTLGHLFLAVRSVKKLKKWRLHDQLKRKQLYSRDRIIRNGLNG